MHIFAILYGIIISSLTITFCLCQYDAFGEADEAAYLGAFDTLIKDSYSARIPQALISQCKNQTQAPSQLTLRSITSSMTSVELQAFCGTDSICHISGGLTVRINS